jgi:hypothetical protein
MIANNKRTRLPPPVDLIYLMGDKYLFLNATLVESDFVAE